MKINVYLVIFLFFSLASFSQELEIVDSNKKSVFQKILGDELKSSITFMPFATHVLTRINLELPYYIGINYKSFEVTTFVNTFDSLCVGFNYKRKWRFSSEFSINYAVGVIYGYGDDIQNLEELPESLKGATSGDVLPVFGLDFVYQFSNKFGVLSTLAPNILLFGGRYYL